MRWGPSRTPGGTLVQGAVPTGRPVVRANGRTARGVVVAAYRYDTSETELFQNQSVQVNDLYVDVLLYGRHNGVLPRVLWTHPRSGLHEGPIVLPRAARLDTSGASLDVVRAKPQALDGDHVIVGFLEDDLAQPYVQACLNHPSSDVGNADKPLGQRMRLVEGDGEPQLWKHRGTVFGVDTSGNFVLDTRVAHGGEYQADGSEPAPTQDGSNGNWVVDLQNGSTITIRIGDGATLVLANQDGNATLTLGDGAVSFAIAENLQTYIDNSVKATFDTHTHPYAFGPTGPPQQPLPAYDTSITSTKAKLPNG